MNSERKRRVVETPAIALAFLRAGLGVCQRLGMPASEIEAQLIEGGVAAEVAALAAKAARTQTPSSPTDTEAVRKAIQSCTEL